MRRPVRPSKKPGGGWGIVWGILILILNLYLNLQVPMQVPSKKFYLKLPKIGLINPDSPPSPPAPRGRRPFTVLKGVRGRIADAAARASDAR